MKTNSVPLIPEAVYSEPLAFALFAGNSLSFLGNNFVTKNRLLESDRILMKIPSLSIFASLALATSVFAADTSVTLKKVHLCCDECVRGVTRSIKGIDGVTLTADKDAETVTLSSADKAALQKAANA